MPKAIFNGTVIAESDDTVVVEGNHYFPSASVNSEYLESSPTTSVCAWKGVASYYDVTVDGSTSSGAAFFYAEPSAAAGAIEGRIAFWKGVEVEA
jgi:uncharacterized protein (DUF427 family)